MENESIGRNASGIPVHDSSNSQRAALTIFFLLPDALFSKNFPYGTAALCFRAAKDHVQPLAALDSFLPNGKKNLI